MKPTQRLALIAMPTFLGAMGAPFDPSNLSPGTKE